MLDSVKGKSDCLISVLNGQDDDDISPPAQASDRNLGTNPNVFELTPLGTDPDFQFQDFEKGDMMHTMADATLAGKELGYSPRTGIEDGLKAEIDWLAKLLEKEA